MSSWLVKKSKSVTHLSIEKGEEQLRFDKIDKLRVPGGSKKNWGLSSLSLSPREIPPRHLPWSSYSQVG